jgi:hypothetical protein
MATLDCTLNALAVPGLPGFNQAFGTKKPENVPVSSREEAVNVAMPFSRERPFSVTEDSNTTTIEANTVFEIKTADKTLSLGQASFNGCMVHIINSTTGNVSVVFGEDECILKAGKSLHLEYNDTWLVFQAGGGSGGGNVYSEFSDLPEIGSADQNYFVIADDTPYKWNNDRSRYEAHFPTFYAFPPVGIAGRPYVADDTQLDYTWKDGMYAEHYNTFTSFPPTGLTDRFYIADDTQYLYEWGEEYGQYMIHFPSISYFPEPGTADVVYIADDTGIRYFWDTDIDQYAPKEGGSGTLGDGDNVNISEENLLTVLGVNTVIEAREELSARLNNEGGSGQAYLGGLKLGMYLDLSSLYDGSETIAKNDTYQNLRIRIAGFNWYKNADNPLNHIVWEFKHIPIKKQMRTDNTNDQGYVKNGGTSVLRPYLEGDFLNGLKAAYLGNRGYSVLRKVTAGQQGAWKKTDLLKMIFPPTEKEVFGTNTYGDPTTEADLSQLPIYARGASKVKNFNGTATAWWEGSPYAAGAAAFCYVGNGGGANYGNASVTYGAAPCFCQS